jgi:hypothetical protein
MTNEERREARNKIKRNCKRDPKTGCHLWTASTRGAGYGQVRWQGKITSAHRLAYEALVGDIPESSVVHHTCGSKLCVNPKHLQITTQAENVAEMLGRTAMQKKIAELEKRLAQYE